MIQDIAPHIFDNQYKPQPPEKDSYLFSFEGRKALIDKKENGIAVPRFRDMETCNDNLYENSTYLFTIDHERFYLAADLTCPTKCGYTFENIEIFRKASPRYLAFAGITAFQLFNWYKSRRFCGKCGKALKQSDKERMMYCESCGHIEYPKISPAVIVGLTHGSKLLMSKYAGREYTNYALLAGFTEIGETIEETVRREVMEEVGLRVRKLKYYKSQPWSFSDTLLLGFYAELDGDEKITLDKEELALAEWFEREDIPDCVNTDSLTNEMIMKFKYGG